VGSFWLIIVGAINAIAIRTLAAFAGTLSGRAFAFEPTENDAKRFLGIHIATSFLFLSRQMS